MRTGLEVWKTQRWEVYIQFLNFSFSWDSFLELLEAAIAGVTSLDVYKLGFIPAAWDQNGLAAAGMYAHPTDHPLLSDTPDPGSPMYSCFRSSKTSDR